MVQNNMVIVVIGTAIVMDMEAGCEHLVTTLRTLPTVPASKCHRVGYVEDVCQPGDLEAEVPAW